MKHHPGQLPRSWALGSVVWGSIFPLLAFASGKAPAPDVPTIDGKKVVALFPVKSVVIEMPDGSLHDFGPDFRASLITKLMQSERYLVTDPSLPSLGALGTNRSLQ